MSDFPAVGPVSVVAWAVNMRKKGKEREGMSEVLTEVRPAEVR